MLDRGKLMAVVGVLTLIVIAYIDVDLVSLGILGFTLAYVYAGYWGLAIRRGLVVGAYRNQALGLSASALYTVLVGGVRGLPIPGGRYSIPAVINALVDFGLMLVFFYWVSTTVPVARRSDPLERDTFSFKTARYFWALALVAPAVFALAYNPIALAFTVAAPLDSLSLALGVAPFVVLLPFGSVLLFVSASRSMDRTLNSHIRWFAGALGAFMVSSASGVVWRATGGNASPYSLLIDPIFLGGQFLAAYCFYRSARSLAPITKSL